MYQPSKNPNAHRVFLVIYGQHATIERCVAVVEAMAEFGDVYLVDTPGFGGMEPSYKIGEYPSLEFYAEHIKNVFDTLLPQDKKVTFFSISYGFEITTMFLYKHPEYYSRVQDVLGFAGLVSHKEFKINWKLRYNLKYLSAGPGRTWLGAQFYHHIVFRDRTLRWFYYFYSRKNPRFIGVDRSKIWDYAEEQAWLWRINDTRTHGATAYDFLFKTDLTNLKVNIPVIHVGVPADHFLDNQKVIDDLGLIFSKVTVYNLDLPSHAPIAFDTPDKLLDVVPQPLKDYLLTSS
jgi:pimeloyl-ACP methyl ester carboxylesterase